MTGADLRDVANSTTSTTIALLALLAIGVLAYGLIRAIAMNRGTQIVVTDIVAPVAGELAESAKLSPVLRQYIRHDILGLRKQIDRIGKEILRSASQGLEPQLHSGVISIQRMANDSIAVISTALRAVAPEQADRFVGLFSALLPPPRGMCVTVTLLEHSTGNVPRLGATVEVARLDGRPLDSVTFWNDKSASSPMVATRDEVLALLEPVSRWAAVRLVVALLVSPRYRSTSREDLGRLLTGGLYLAAMNAFPSHAATFGDEACTELELARTQMPRLSLPVATLAGVHERMGLAQRYAGCNQQDFHEFRIAARLWKEAQDLTDHNDTGYLTEVIDRRLKAQLESGHPGLRSAALAELDELDSSSTPSALLSNRVWLYNRACLYAQASEARPDSGYQQKALYWLGQALIRDPNSGRWNYAEHQDFELAPIRGNLHLFLTSLLDVTPNDPEQLSDKDAEKLVTQVLSRLPRHRRRHVRFVKRHKLAVSGLPRGASKAIVT